VDFYGDLPLDGMRASEIWLIDSSGAKK